MNHITVMEQALDALDSLTDRIDGTGFSESDEFSYALDVISALRAAIAQPTKPLTTEQWGAIALGVGCDADRDDPVLVGKLVRAIEAAHGIKEQS